MIYKATVIHSSSGYRVVDLYDSVPHVCSDERRRIHHYCSYGRMHRSRWDDDGSMPHALGNTTRRHSD